MKRDTSDTTVVSFPSNWSWSAVCEWLCQRNAYRYSNGFSNVAHVDGQWTAFVAA